ncbi:hypothetical protein AALP_AA2G178400 [Arabis alpina]|uniref:2-isopropylmalate synthase n=1 Tax=Arabis alpina TaxID=50452 RepID=A0A087HI90_ARAAL|nr:hypothetical protein AALP_AA2G178400 [Arabis alpina]
MVAFARSLGCEDVEFSPEDAGRSEREYLYEILGEVIKAGAITLNIPDTVGITLPSEFGQLIADIKANTHGIQNVIISTHCQNDLGLSTANTLSGAHSGARQVEVTINGIGERAGNASLEEVVMAIKCRGDHVLGGLFTGIDTRHIVMTSKMVEEYTGMQTQPHKAIVGANAFAHESGIHQDGMLKHKGTYEIMCPEEIGLERSNEAGILGYELDDVQLSNLFWRFKSVADQKKRVTDADLIALVSDEVFQPEAVWTLLDMQITCGTLGLSTSTVKLANFDGKEHVACSIGTGPVDAAYKAVDLIVKEPTTLLEYSMNGVTEGIDAITTTRVLIRGDNNYSSTNAVTGESVQRTFSGTGAGMDVVVSSVKAYVGALNKMLGFKEPPLEGFSSYSIKCFIYNTTFGIAKNPAEDGRSVNQLLGRLVSREKFHNVTECIIHNHDCNYNASKNSNVWTFCCAQPLGCEDRTMFDKPGEWSWKYQYQQNEVPEECSYNYCLSCKGCQLSILKAIVHQWKYLSMFSYPVIVISCISLALAWSLKETIHEVGDYRGSYS